MVKRVYKTLIKSYQNSDLIKNKTRSKDRVETSVRRKSRSGSLSKIEGNTKAPRNSPETKMTGTPNFSRIRSKTCTITRPHTTDCPPKLLNLALNSIQKAMDSKSKISQDQVVAKIPSPKTPSPKAQGKQISEKIPIKVKSKIPLRPKSKNQLQLKVRINPKTEVINKSPNQVSDSNTEENQVQNRLPSAWKNPPPPPMSLLHPTKSKFRIRSPTPGPSKSKSESETKSQVLRIKSNASQVSAKPESSQNSKVRTRSRSSQIREIRKM